MDFGPPRKKLGAGPKFITCYICGRGFGTKSLSIHQKTCKKMFLLEQEKKPKHLRQPLPEPPTEEELAKMMSGDRGAIEEANEKAWQQAQSLLQPCPNCGRTFNPDRLPIHLRSCRPGSTSKPIGAPTLGGAGAPNHPAIKARGGTREKEEIGRAVFAATLSDDSGTEVAPARRRSSRGPTGSGHRHHAHSGRPRTAPGPSPPQGGYKKVSPRVHRTSHGEAARGEENPHLPAVGSGHSLPSPPDDLSATLHGTHAGGHAVPSGNRRMISALESHVATLEGQISSMQGELASMKALLAALRDNAGAV